MSEWKLVPVEPDAAMVRAGQHALMDRDYSGAVFKAMLAAAPPTPSAEPVKLHDPAVQKRLAAQWGYVPAPSAEPPAAPTGEEEVTRLVRWLTTPSGKGAK
jgi:hypothetical protein